MSLRTTLDTVCVRSDIQLRRRGIEVSFVEQGKFYKGDHTYYKVIASVFKAEIVIRRSPEELNIGTHGLEWNW